MDDKVLNKVDNIISHLNGAKEIIRLNEIKKEIDSDKKLSSLISDYNIQKDKFEKHVLSSDVFMSIKKQVFSYPLIDEYFKLQLEVYYLITYINKRLLSLISFHDGQRICHKR